MPSAIGGTAMSLPAVPVPSAAELLVKDPGPPPGGRPCGKDGCDEVVGIGYGGQPAASRGFCPRCGAPFSFEPELHPGDLLGGQYEVVGRIAGGGLGWIYLARDTHLDNRHVALKGLKDVNDAAALRVAEAERRFLVELDHPDIVRIINFVTWQDTGYIVMEFVGGRSLEELRTPEGQRRVLGGPLRLEHVAVYGCRILDALEYLHGRGLLYCDMKPANVMHYDNRVKVIDLGAVRRIDDHESPTVYSAKYLPPGELYAADGTGISRADGRGSPRFSRLTDLFTVARTLSDLVDAAVPGPEVAQDSFRRLIARATSRHRRARFATAAEMSEQLRGVWREIHSLAHGSQHVGQSAVFSPGAVLLDGGLGESPPSRDQARPPGPGTPRLDLGLPAPERVATGLPDPVPHPDSPNAALELRGCGAAMARGDRAAAETALVRACELLGPAAARHDWRVAWTYGRLLLAGGDRPATGSAVHRLLDVPTGPRSGARDWFDAVCDALPGEPAPKLVLAYCAERAGEPERAEPLYQAVWQRDHSDGSAAFGLARIRLAAGDRAAALAILDQVPPHAPHRGAARLAALRIQAGWPAGHAPEAGDFVRVQERMRAPGPDSPRPGSEERARLTAEIRESALHWARTRGWSRAGLPAGELFGDPPGERSLRELLERSFRELAHRAGSAEEHGALIDRANQVRPMTLR
ncbi:tetratricopeptide repeat protein [Streptomyces sp. NPDC002018]|uniref:serine/threonine-protein kinase n=1 Tax=Streptomyces sp. NPDC002018 TaxID=3364629 RepID=UPI003686DF75